MRARYASLRMEFPGAVYHLTSRGNARQKIFFSDVDRELFLNTLTHVVSRYGWICHSSGLKANVRWRTSSWRLPSLR